MEKTELSNLAGITLTGNWELPAPGTTGTIQNTDTGMYLSVNDNTDDGSEVVEEALDDADVGQQWERSANDDSGFFTLKNIKSGKFLNVYNTTNILTIEGTASFLCVCICFFTMLLFTYRSNWREKSPLWGHFNPS